MIEDTQRAFMHSRNTVHNIMIVQELLKHYNRKVISPNCIIKLDMQKAYHLVDGAI